MSTFQGFPTDTLRFLSELSDNNNREWFAENKDRYEQSFLEPALALITSLDKPLSKTAPALKAEAKKMGGSLMRIYKDTRFSKDKTPYKTNIGIHLRHRVGKDVHAPGAYLHIAVGECFLGVGIWRPASDALRAIREFIVENPTSWRKAIHNRRFAKHFEIYDDRLKSAPRGYAKDHPSIDDLRLRSFLGMTTLTRNQIESKELVTQIPSLIHSARPLMEFLCAALNQPY